MTYKLIMTPYLTSRSGQCGFDAGVVIAKRFKAHLDVVHMRRRFSVPASGYYPIAETYIEENFDALMASEKQLASDLKHLFKDQCVKQSIDILEAANHTDDKGATASWSDLTANYLYDLAARARITDLICMARPGADTLGNEIDLITEIIFQSGRPTLIVGDDAMTKFPETIAVAWNGGREAARAMDAALPILKQAQQVFVTTIGKPAWACEPSEKAVAYLRLHGINALCSHPQLKKHEKAEAVFLEHAKKREVELIVMGAYSHSRWREVVLGGFTRHMLRNSDIPLLMAH